MKRLLAIIACSVCCDFVAAQTYALQQIKDSALHNNIAIRNARYSIEAAQQQRKEAFTKYFPNVSGTGLWFNANKGMAKMVTPTGIQNELCAMIIGTTPTAVVAVVRKMGTMRRLPAS